MNMDMSYRVVFGGEKEMVYEASVDGRQLGNISSFKYFAFVLNESSTA